MMKTFPNILKTATIETVLGTMMAVADEKVLYLLEFADCKTLERKLKRLSLKTRSTLIPGTSAPIKSIEKELDKYFNGDLLMFQTPLSFLGTVFQERVWAELVYILPTTTCFYSQIALAIGKPTAFRAVAQAIGANPLAVIVPCHRVINSDGKLGGYAGGLKRKQWLLQHEIRLA